MFGDTCTLEQVQAELLGYSDYRLHCLARSNAPRFYQFLLDPEHLMDSAKCRALAELLPKLKVSHFPSGSRARGRLPTNTTCTGSVRRKGSHATKGYSYLDAL